MSGIIFGPRFRVASANPTLSKIVDGHLAASYTTTRDTTEWIVDTSRSQYAVRALDWMFKRPIFRSSDFVQSVEIPKPTALRILRVARDTGLLAVVRPGGGRRAGVFAFSELINIAEGRTVFEVSLESETRPSSTTQFDTDT